MLKGSGARKGDGAAEKIGPEAEQVKGMTGVVGVKGVLEKSQKQKTSITLVLP